MSYADRKDRDKYKRLFWMINIWLYAYFIFFNIYAVAVLFIEDNIYYQTISYIPYLPFKLKPDAANLFGPNSLAYKTYSAVYDKYRLYTFAFYIVYFGTCISVVISSLRNKSR